MKNIWWITILAGIIFLTFIATCWVFDTSFAETTIDWFAFLAGIYLVVEGIYKILKYKAPFFPSQFLRFLRVVIGACVFTIHLLQFMRF